MGFNSVEAIQDYILEALRDAGDIDIIIKLRLKNDNITEPN